MKYLVYIGPGIGDWIISLPMARRIKLNDPSAHITFFTKSSKSKVGLNRTMLLLQEWVDEIGYYSMKEPLHNIKFLFQLGIKRYDMFFKSSYLDNTYISNWPNRIMSIAAKKGVGVKLSNKPNFKYDYEIAFNKNRNVYETPLELLDMIGIRKHRDEDKYPLLDVKKVEKEFKHLGIIDNGKCIAIVPGTAPAPVTADGKNGSKLAKSWPYEYWDALAERLIEDGYRVILLGGDAEKQQIQELNFFQNKAIINLCGRTSIVESCAVLCHCLLTIGGDTGMMHCSGAVGTPSITLFGCTDYRNYLAYGKKSYYIASKKQCSPCFGGAGLLSCNDFLCMREITVNEVYDKMISIIKENLKDNEKVDED